MYDAMESLFQRVQDYLKRVSIHLKPTIPPSLALLDIIVDTLVHIFTMLALTTKYCHSASENDSQLKQAFRPFIRRTSVCHSSSLRAQYLPSS